MQNQDMMTERDIDSIARAFQRALSQHQQDLDRRRKDKRLDRALRVVMILTWIVWAAFIVLLLTLPLVRH